MPRSSRTDYTILSPHERERYGVTVTATDGKRFLALQRPGLVEPALLEVCKVLDALKGDWRILSVSTPNTIFSDLTRNFTSPRRERPEVHLLGRIGRIDLLASAHTRTLRKAHLSG